MNYRRIAKVLGFCLLIFAGLMFLPLVIGLFSACQVFALGEKKNASIVHEIATFQPGQGNSVANYEYYRSCFGDLSTVLERDVNPEVLARKLKAAGAKIPDIYMACGTEDFLIEPNRAFHRFLEEEGIAHEYRESKGVHDMVFWREYIEKVVEWMFA